jgi:hypothetical protein
MNKTKPLVILMLILSCSIVQGQDSLTYKNNFKISILSFADNAKLQYERVLTKSFSFDITASYYYFKPLTGIKAEPSFRYYFKKNAPTGWYIQPKFSIGYFSTQEKCSKILYTYSPNDSLLSTDFLDKKFIKELRFMPVGASVKFGIQKYFGKKKRFVFDYNLGLQYFPLNYKIKDEKYEYIDTDGNKKVLLLSKSWIKESIPEKVLYWYLFGPGSFFETNISLGFNF